MEYCGGEGGVLWRSRWPGDEEKEKKKKIYFKRTYLTLKSDAPLRVNGIVVRVYNDNDRRSRPSCFFLYLKHRRRMFAAFNSNRMKMLNYCISFKIKNLFSKLRLVRTRVYASTNWYAIGTCFRFARFTISVYDPHVSRKCAPSKRLNFLSLA